MKEILNGAPVEGFSTLEVILDDGNPIFIENLNN
jgi:hypothetical protein